MKLNVKERLLLLGILPKEDNRITLKIIRDLKENLSFSEKEIKELNFKDEMAGDKIRTTWNINNEKEKEIEIGEKATEIIINTFKNLDSQKKINDDLDFLWNKFEIKKD